MKYNMVNRKRSRAAKLAAAKRKENAAKKAQIESADREKSSTDDGSTSKSINWDEIYINTDEDRVFLNPITDPSVLAKFERLEIDIQHKQEADQKEKVIAKTPQKGSSNLSIANSEALYTPLTCETPAKLVTNCKGELPDEIQIRLTGDEGVCELKKLTLTCDEDAKASPTTFQFNQPQDRKEYSKSAKKLPSTGNVNLVTSATPKLEVTQCELTTLLSSQAEASLINQLVNTTHGEVMKDILENPSAITATPVINDTQTVGADASQPTNSSLNESLMVFAQYEQMCQQVSSPQSVVSSGVISSPSKLVLDQNKNDFVDDSSNHHLAAIPEEDSFALPVDDSAPKTPAKENASRFALPSSVSVRRKKLPGNLFTPKEARSPLSPCNLNTPMVKIGDETMEMLMKTHSRFAQFTTPSVARGGGHLVDSSSPLTLETPARLIDVTCFNPSALRQSLVFTEDDVNELTFLGSLRKAPPKRVTRSSINARRSSLQLMNADLLDFSTSNPDTDI